MAVVLGACLCGGITFEVSGSPEAVLQCYCNHCQKNAGGPFQIVAKYDKDLVNIKTGTDLLKHYVLTDTQSGYPKHKVFCSACGCTVWTVPMRHGDVYRIVRVTLLEDGLKKFKPDKVLFEERKLDE
ncbi:uncharacterized protein TRUGW13939_05890 [Talaromyces rugulosus]|uniref:CENP-V/GFA domain-containing protein n=1 Tax=Talaromyces rugulosus TaxID=121627 RepID=A0A7H8R1K4_TALRU|nr:uncharacterized protein TRUGW13939_05890 [Talaromyces rugulosus]QKX58763.1 hypothetical protein TRUGW13939_05890 [Talaromyces rugulosus]